MKGRGMACLRAIYSPVRYTMAETRPTPAEITEARSAIEEHFAPTDTTGWVTFAALDALAERPALLVRVAELEADHAEWPALRDRCKAILSAWSSVVGLVERSGLTTALPFDRLRHVCSTCKPDPANESETLARLSEREAQLHDALVRVAELEQRLKDTEAVSEARREIGAAAMARLEKVEPRLAELEVTVERVRKLIEKKCKLGSASYGWGPSSLSISVDELHAVLAAPGTTEG